MEIYWALVSYVVIEQLYIRAWLIVSSHSSIGGPSGGLPDLRALRVAVMVPPPIFECEEFVIQ